jgi:hypothetical protein
MAGETKGAAWERGGTESSDRDTVPGLGELRRHVRYYYRCRPPARFGVRGAVREGEAQLHDISLGGAGLLVHRQIEPGSVLFVQLSTARPGATITQLAEAAHARRLGPLCWLVGRKFACNVREEELRQILGNGDTTTVEPPDGPTSAETGAGG